MGWMAGPFTRVANGPMGEGKMAELVTSCDAGGRGVGRFETGARLQLSWT